MSDLNKIYPSEPIDIRRINTSYLCFIDDFLVFSNKYAFSNNSLEVYQQALENINVFYNYDSSSIYEYNILLNNSGTIISGSDNNGSILSGMNNNNVMIFVNGRLLQKYEYEVLDSENVAILYSIPQLYLQQVCIYVSDSELYYNQFDSSTDYDEDILNDKYNEDSSLIFVNGKKIDKQFIEVHLNSEDNTKSIKINYLINSSDIVEMYDLGSTTKSLNFSSTLGYSVFGPKDSYNKPIPKLYNSIITFNTIARLAIDNLREGIIFSDKDDLIKLIVVDDDFESYEIKCFTDNTVFPKYSFSEGEYYIESPTVRSIVEYLSAFDKKNKIFIPEILDVFQNTVLKEVYDSIIRLKDIRNISKVDSYHINKLLSLLGVNLNIKTLSLKQRHELLEELNEFYRIVGTKDSYNLINVIQDNIKLISMNQLFTPIYNIPLSGSETKNYVSYSYNIISKGENYKVGNKLYFSFYDEKSNSNIGFNFTVSEIDDNGGIKAVTSNVYDGESYDALLNTFNLLPVNLDLHAELTTINVLYNYNYSITNSSSNFRINNELVDQNGEYKILVTGIDGSGKITNFNILKGPTSGVSPLTVSNLHLDLVSYANYTLNVTSSELSRTTILSDSTNIGVTRQIYLTPGTYVLTLKGGSGGGGSAFHEHTGNSHSYKGYTGQTSTYVFTLDKSNTFDYVIGAGGGGGYTRNYGAINGAGGAGFYRGNDSSGAWAGSHDHHEASCAGGGGGGATGIRATDGSLLYVAAGGNGGNADAWRWHGGSGNSTGGSGGYGGYTSGGTNDGGTNSWRNWAGTGASGYIDLKKINYKYSGSLLGDLQDLIDGEILTSTDNAFSVQIRKNGSTVSYNLTPSSGDLIINKTYNLLRKENRSADLNINSVLADTTNSISNLTGNYSNLFVGAELTATVTDPTVPTFTATGVVTEKNNRTGNVKINWTLPDIKYDSYIKSPMDISVGTGTNATLKVQTYNVSSKNTIREYVDFYTIEDLGGKLKYGLITPEINYGPITEGTPGSPNPQSPGLPDYDYGLAINSETFGIDADYGSITDDINGVYVKWWEWDRPKKYYPTNHVNVEIKMEDTSNEEDLKKKFIDQFYNLASTVLYLHSIACSYFFGSDDLPSGKIDPQKNTIFLGIKTGQPIEYQSFTLTSDPARQSSTNNLN